MSVVGIMSIVTGVHDTVAVRTMPTVAMPQAMAAWKVLWHHLRQVVVGGLQYTGGLTGWLAGGLATRLKVGHVAEGWLSVLELVMLWLWLLVVGKGEGWLVTLVKWQHVVMLRLWSLGKVMRLKRVP